MADRTRPVEILLVEDNPGDARLTQEAFRESDTPCNITIVRDGNAAIKFLTKKDEYFSAPRPDLILLDLNLPKKDGREVLQEIKEDSDLRRIPVVVLTTSESEDDIRKVYSLHANCYIKKPVDLDDFDRVVKTIEAFWLNLVRLPED
ncbi:response regulator [Limisalsivibrio acetivorans]|uniref:response regulator n=1 Tax=Limisalsivibrio acetivorans TaxID=1304888 RepID=UPI0003B3B9E4|nr:response regulator [Limisalsivibrio acetivorans]